MRTHYLGNTTIKVQLAENWDELSRWQLVELARAFNKEMDIKTAIKKFVFILNATKKSLIRQFVYAFVLTPEERHQEDVIAQWILEPKVLTKDTIKTIKVGRFFRTTLYGPGDMLKNTSFIEFIKADAYIKMYQKTKEEKYLNLFVATLYRPAFDKKHITELPSDIRAKHNDYQVEQMANKLTTVPLEVKTVVIWYFIGCLETIITEFEFLFPEENQAKGNSNSWVETLIRISGEKHGTSEQTAYTNLHTILFDLNLRNMDALKNPSTTTR